MNAGIVGVDPQGLPALRGELIAGPPETASGAAGEGRQVGTDLAPGKRDERPSNLGANSGQENHRGGENARSTSLTPRVSPVKVVLEASDSLQRAEVVVELPPILAGGEPLRSPPQHHLSLAAAYLAGSEVHGELRRELRCCQSKQTAAAPPRTTSSRVETPDDSVGRQCWGREEACSAHSLEPFLPPGEWTRATISTLPPLAPVPVRSQLAEEQPGGFRSSSLVLVSAGCHHPRRRDPSLGERTPPVPPDPPRGTRSPPGPAGQGTAGAAHPGRSAAPAARGAGRCRRS